MQFLKDIFYLFFPKICTTCSTKLLQNESFLCTQCRHDLPIICYNDYQKNKIAATFYGRVPIEKATSFLYFYKEGKTQQLIHQLKYKGNQQVGAFLGKWFGQILKETNQFTDIDYIIPVPLHPTKFKKRGYNQLTTFGLTLSEVLQIEYKTDILLKINSTKTQTYKKRFERFSDSETKFQISDTNFLESKHILLIDDVITTGATLEACILELLKTKNLKISIATISYTA